MADHDNRSKREQFLEIAFNPIGSLSLRERLESDKVSLAATFKLLSPYAVTLILSPSGYRIIECFLNANIEDLNVGLSESLSGEWKELEQVMNTVKGRFVCDALLSREVKTFAHTLITRTPKDWWFKNTDSLPILIKALDCGEIDVVKEFISHGQTEIDLCDTAEGLYCVLKVRVKSMDQPGWTESLKTLVLLKVKSVEGSEALVQVIVYGDLLAGEMLKMVFCRRESFSDSTTISFIIRVIKLSSVNMKRLIFHYFCTPKGNPMICQIRSSDRFDDIKQVCDSHFTPAQREKLEEYLAEGRVESVVDECLNAMKNPEGEEMDTTPVDDGKGKKRKMEQSKEPSKSASKKPREEVKAPPPPPSTILVPPPSTVSSTVTVQETPLPSSSIRPTDSIPLQSTQSIVPTAAKSGKRPAPLSTPTAQVFGPALPPSAPFPPPVGDTVSPSTTAAPTTVVPSTKVPLPTTVPPPATIPKPTTVPPVTTVALSTKVSPPTTVPPPATIPKPTTIPPLDTVAKPTTIPPVTTVALSTKVSPPTTVPPPPTVPKLTTVPPVTTVALSTKVPPPTTVPPPATVPKPTTVPPPTTVPKPTTVALSTSVPPPNTVPLPSTTVATPAKKPREEVKEPPLPPLPLPPPPPPPPPSTTVVPHPSPVPPPTTGLVVSLPQPSVLDSSMELTNKVKFVVGGDEKKKRKTPPTSDDASQSAPSTSKISTGSPPSMESVIKSLQQRADPGEHMIYLAMGEKNGKILKELETPSRKKKNENKLAFNDFPDTCFSFMEKGLLALMMNERGTEVVQWFIKKGSFVHKGKIENIVMENVEVLVESGGYGRTIVTAVIENCIDEAKKKRLSEEYDKAIFSLRDSSNYGLSDDDEIEITHEKIKDKPAKDSKGSNGNVRKQRASGSKPRDNSEGVDVPKCDVFMNALRQMFDEIDAQLRDGTMTPLVNIKYTHSTIMQNIIQDASKHKLFSDLLKERISNWVAAEKGMSLLEIFVTQRSYRPLMAAGVASILPHLTCQKGENILSLMMFDIDHANFADICFAGGVSSPFAALFHAEITIGECLKIGMAMAHAQFVATKMRLFFGQFGRQIAEATEMGKVFFEALARPRPKGVGWTELLVHLPPTQSRSAQSVSSPFAAAVANTKTDKYNPFRRHGMLAQSSTASSFGSTVARPAQNTANEKAIPSTSSPSVNKSPFTTFRTKVEESDR